MTYIVSSSHAFCKRRNRLGKVSPLNRHDNPLEPGSQQERGRCPATIWTGQATEAREAQGPTSRGWLDLTNSCANLGRSPSVCVVMADVSRLPGGRPRASHGFLLETIGGSSCSSHVSSCTFFTFLLDLARLGHCHLKKIIIINLVFEI